MFDSYKEDWNDASHDVAHIVVCLEWKLALITAKLQTVTYHDMAVGGQRADLVQQKPYPSHHRRFNTGAYYSLISLRCG
jgi:hypothetical protein